MQVLHTEDNFGGVKLGPLIIEILFPLQVKEHFTPVDKVHDKVKLVRSLEGEVEVHQERVAYRGQD
jgi:hypothetical protein